MSKAGTTHVIEIETGIGEPAFIPLTVGQELQPISVGKKGMWRIESARVLDVHAFVYFDGTSLFLQSADESQAASVDGYRVGKAWTELHAPCKIEVGAARLRFRSLTDNAEAAQESQPIPAPPPRPTMASANGPASIGGNTRVGPSDRAESRPLPALPDDAPSNGSTSRGSGLAHHSTGAPVQAIPQSQRPANLMNAMSGGHNLPQTMPPPHMSGMNPSLSGMGGMGSPMPMMAPMPSGGSGGYGALGSGSVSLSGSRIAPTVSTNQPDGLLGKYKELNPQKRLLVLMAPFCILASGYLLLFDDEPPPEVPNMAMDAGPPVPSTPQVVAVLPTTAPVKCPAGYIPWTREVNGQIPCVPSGTPLPPPTAPTAPIAPTAPTVPTGPVALTGSSVAPQPTAPTGREPTGGQHPAGQPPPVTGKTLERQAVDAVAVGEYLRAASIYDTLYAQSNPKNPVYSEAARILRQKADAGLQ